MSEKPNYLSTYPNQKVIAVICRDAFGSVSIRAFADLGSLLKALKQENLQVVKIDETPNPDEVEKSLREEKLWYVQ